MRVFTYLEVVFNDVTFSGEILSRLIDPDVRLAGSSLVAARARESV